jgi:hypothetical protein
MPDAPLYESVAKFLKKYLLNLSLAQGNYNKYAIK